MRDFTDKCVVLKISDYRDDDRLAKVLTAENGMITVCGTRSRPSRKSFSCFWI